ncbi:MAG: apolipoprotein N-acyltransferase [Streptosporangiaceae bacterium]
MRLPRLPRSLRRAARWGSLVAGALPLLAFPPADLSYLAWFALVPGMLLIHRAPSAREAAIRGWWLGCGYFVAAMYWLAPEIGPAVIIVAIVFGALLGPFGKIVWLLLRPPVSVPRALAALVVVPSCWLVTEWLRSWQALGGPWAVLGASQWQHPAVLALASVGGVWLVSFAIVAVNVAVLIAIVSGRLAARLVAAAAAAVVLAAGPVAFALTPPARDTGTATIALVQPGVVSSSVLGASQVLTASLSRTGSLRGVRPDLIVWGESSATFHLQADQSLLRSIEKLSATDHAQILVNQDSVFNAKKSKVAVLVGPTGIDGTYTKTRLVPFGEYIPFRAALSWLTSISKAAPVNMVPGDGAHTLRVTGPAGRALMIGPLICFESAFPDMSRVDTDRGAQVIVYQTADPTFQGTGELAQHASLGALRAAETGRPVVQAALTGDSAAFDARGRLVAWMGESRRGVTAVRLTLPAVTSLTLYDQLGDYVPWTAVGVAAVFALAGLAGRIRRRRSRGPGGYAGGDGAEYDTGTGLHVSG